MGEKLNKSELEQLYKFRLSTEKRVNDLSIPINELFIHHALLEHIEKIGAHINSPNLRVTASIFVKRYAFLAVMYLYGITAWNKKLIFRDIRLQSDLADQLWIPQFYIENIKAEKAGENRSDWREKALGDFFSNHVQPLIDQLSKAAKQSKLVLWENIAVYIFWLYETVFQQCDDEELRRRAKEDFYYLIYEAPGSLYGNEPENPIKKCFYEKKNIDEIRIRTTCCLSYMLEGSSKRCKTCPKK